MRLTTVFFIFIVLVPSCMNRRKADDTTLTPDQNANVGALGLSNQSIPLEDPAKLNPNVVQIEATPVDIDTIAMITVPAIAVDFVKWQSCDRSQKCVNGWSNRPIAFLVDLPEGQQTIQVQVCLRKDHSTTKAEVCSDWGQGFVFTQQSRKNPTLQKWMVQQESVNQGFNKLGIELQGYLEDFNNKASQCSDKNDAVLKTIQAAISRGPDVLAGNLSNLGSPMMTAANGGLFAFGDEPNVDSTIGTQADLRMKMQQNADRIQSLKVAIQSGPQVTADQKRLSDLKVQKSDLAASFEIDQTRLASVSERISHLKGEIGKLKGMNEDYVRLINDAMDSYEHTWEANAQTANSKLDPTRSYYIKATSREALVQELVFDSPYHSTASLKLIRHRIETAKTNLTEANWRTFGDTYEGWWGGYNTSRENLLFERLTELEGALSPKHFFEYEKNPEFSAGLEQQLASLQDEERALESKLALNRDSLNKLSSEISRESRNIELDSAHKQRIAELEDLNTEQAALKKKLDEAEHLNLRKSPFAVVVEHPSAESLSALVPAERRLAVMTTQSVGVRASQPVFEQVTSLLNVIKGQRLESMFEGNGPIRHLLFDERSGAMLGIERLQSGQFVVTLGVVQAPKTGGQAPALLGNLLESNEGRLAIMGSETLSGAPISGLLQIAPGKAVKAVAYQVGENVVFKFHFEDLSQLGKAFNGLQRMDETQFSKFFAQVFQAPFANTGVAQSITGPGDVKLLTYEPALAGVSKVDPVKTPALKTSATELNPMGDPEHPLHVEQPPRPEEPMKMGESGSTLKPMEDVKITPPEGNNFGTGAKVAVGIGTTLVFAAIVTASAAGAGAFDLSNSCFADQLSTLRSNINSVHDRALKYHNESDILQFLILDQLGLVDQLLMKP